MIQQPDRTAKATDEHGQFSTYFFRWLIDLATAVNLLSPATTFTGSVVLAKVTPTGANGSMTLVKGIVTALTPPT